VRRCHYPVARDDRWGHLVTFHIMPAEYPQAAGCGPSRRVNNAVGLKCPGGQPLPRRAYSTREGHNVRLRGPDHPNPILLPSPAVSLCLLFRPFFLLSQRRPPGPPYAILPPASDDTDKGLTRLAVLAYGGPLKDGNRRVAQLTRRPEQVIQTLPDSVQRRPPLGVPLRVAIDAALIALGFWLAYQLRYELGFPEDVSRDTVVNGIFVPGDYRPFGLFAPVLALLEALLLLAFAARGVYRQPRWTGFLDEALLVGSSALLSFSVLIVAVFYYQKLAFSRAIFLYALVIIVGLLLLWRLAWRGTVTWMRARGRWTERVLVVGAGPAGERVMSALLGQPGLGYTLAGFVDDTPSATDWAIATQRAVIRPARLGAIHDLPETIRSAAIDEVIIALPSNAHDQLYWTIEQCRHGRVSFTLVPDLFELSLDRVSIHALNGLPLISTQDSGLRGPNAGIKRAFDLLVGGVGLLLVGLPMLLIAALIRLDSRGPALYGQRRVGRDGRHFTCYKFRSMHTGAHEDYARLAASTDYTGDRVAFKMKDDPRVTRIGKLLRRTSLDELPNLLNVLRGDMSLVGPRPHVPEEVEKYDPWHRQRLSIVPGLTCLWQVNGRSDLTFDEQVRFDLYYAESWSIWLDIKILLWTIPAVVTRRGAY